MMISISNNIDKKWAKFLASPGLCLQKITTKNPDDSQLEIALTSLKEILKLENNKNND